MHGETTKFDLFGIQEYISLTDTMAVDIVNACLMILEREIGYVIRTEFLLVVVH